jgi:hypothetical protein
VRISVTKRSKNEDINTQAASLFDQAKQFDGRPVAILVSFGVIVILRGKEPLFAERVLPQLKQDTLNFSLSTCWDLNFSSASTPSI